MPPLGLAPNRPAGAPDITSWGYGAGMTPSTPSAVASDTERWDAYIRMVRDAMQQSAGWEREKYRRELEDAEKGRANAYRIAELQAQTSRYGTDRQTEVELAQLEENQRQFDANHGLEMQRFGLDVANAYTQYASTPDRYFQLNDFVEGLGRAGVGSGPSPYGAVGQPQAKGWEQFAALAGFDNLPAVQAGQPGAGMAAAGGGQTQGGGDPRLKAAQGILKAIPISDGQGMDDDDFAALSAIENVFRASKPGTLERFRPGQRAMFASGLSRMGYWAPDAIEQMKRNGIGQSSARLA